MTFCTKTQASVEGQIFLEINENSTTFSLDKVLERGIENQNVRGAFLKISTLEKEISIIDLNFEEEYFLKKENGSFEITDIFKKNLSGNFQNLKFSLSSEFCKKDCKSNEYPHIKVRYSFNNPPEIRLLKPADNFFGDSSEIYFNWMGRDNDGRFLEYSVEIFKDGIFDENRIEKTNWSKDDFYKTNLQQGAYFWKVYVRDNSFLENVSVSDTFHFEIKKIEKNKIGKEEETTLLKPNIVFPKEGFKTNLDNIKVFIETDEEVNNKVFLNEKLIKETNSTRIELILDLEKEGLNIIKVVSERGKNSTRAFIEFETNWTPPKTPKFDFKLVDEEVFLKILNDDYEKAYIYINEELFMKIDKNFEWISLGNEIYGDTKIGVLLEDDFGNKTEILYKTFSPDEEVLGIGRSGQKAPPPSIPSPNLCLFRYNSTYGRFEHRWCNIRSPQILRVENTTTDNRSYEVNIAGVYNPHLVILIDEYRCTLPIICRSRFVKRDRIFATPYTAIANYVNETFVSMNEFRRINKYLFTSHLLEKNNPERKRLNLRYHINHGFRYKGQWVDINLTSTNSNTRAIPLVKKLPSKRSQKIFNFPFSKNIGVTQWHGYTAFQSPHTGIDFGAYRESVYAIGDGIIREAKWDNYSGVCLSGGYFVRIEHNNGMNSVYLHLENYKKNNGNNWRVGERIKKGDLIGRTGNTGAYNCQPLGYHLHFELRKNQYQRNHINPVPHINVNWNNIPTLNYIKYPGRLTGDNPHPTW